MTTSNNIRIVNSDSRFYPEKLRQLKDAPQKLYCIGDLSLLLQRTIAVVGSRKCSEYGKRTAINIGKSAACNNLTVVSGMAKGIDSFGHLGALNNNGRTIAVLGCGVDVCYPPENLNLYRRICAEGLVVSEFEPGFKPRPYTFPQRNRIIAALSEAVVVVEAGTNSGALITADMAMEQGREVFVVPGNITSIYSLGSNKLLVDGARPIAVIDDIFYGLGITPAINKAELNKLGKEEEQVYKIVEKKGEVSIDYICAELDKSPALINGIVTVLEIKGLVAYNFGKIFIAKF